VGRSLSDEPLSLRQAVRADVRQASIGQRAALFGLVGWLFYEWGPGNETVTPWLLIRVLRNTSGWGSVIATSTIGFAFTFCQQLAAGFTALTAFSQFEHTADAAWRRLRRFGDTPGAWHTLSWSSRMALSFGLGTSAVALTETIATGRTGVARHRRTVVLSAVLAGSLVAVLGAGAGGTTMIAEKVPSWRQPTQTTLTWLAKPWVWLLFGALLLGVRAITGHRGTASTEPTAD
jgi:hypothetical protein